MDPYIHSRNKHRFLSWYFVNETDLDVAMIVSNVYGK